MPTAEQMRHKEEKYARMDSVEREICEQQEVQRWRERVERQETRRLKRQEKERQRQLDAHQDKLERQTQRWVLQALQYSTEDEMY
jgi:hypothetical protein